jgi:hypothetical protein
MTDPVDSELDDNWATKFSGKLFLVLLDRKREPSTRGGRSLWALSEDITFSTDDGPAKITVPRGFVTDLTSIPRLVWTVLPPDGPWVKAAIIHDFLYATAGDGIMWKRAPSIDPVTVYDRAQADRILLEAMVNRYIPPLPRTIIYLAVRIGGCLGWGKDRHGENRHAKKRIKATKQRPPTEEQVLKYIGPPTNPPA